MKINILEYFEKTVLLVPEKIAIIDGENQISFKELSSKAKKLALELIKLNKINLK